MSEPYLWLKTLHVLSAIVLFGAGLGTAFQMWAAHLGGDPRTIAGVARNVVRADWAMTTPAIIVQPASGVALLLLAGIDPAAPWLVASYVLYGIAAACWLPVVVLQYRVRDMAAAAVAADRPLPPAYGRCMAWWFALGWPAFFAMTGTVWLMVAKPDF